MCLKERKKCENIKCIYCRWECKAIKLKCKGACNIDASLFIRYLSFIFPQMEFKEIEVTNALH